jgi:SAM-dependent methyltransferase
MPDTRPAIASHGRYRFAYDFLPASGRILDYGSGSGGFIKAVASARDVEAHACDINPESVARLADTGVTAHHISGRDPRLPFPDGYLSAVTMCDVLEHLPPGSRPDVLREVRRVLAPDGVLVITVPHAGAVAWADPENFKFRFPRLHRLIYRASQRPGQYEEFYGDSFGNYTEGATEHHHFSLGELTGLLAASGFVVKEVRYFTLFEPFLHVLLWLRGGLRNRMGWRPGRLHRLLWRWYTWDSDFDAGRLSGSIAVCARQAPG